MTDLIHDSQSTLGSRSPVDVLPILAEPLPRELNDLIAQLVAFETRKRGGGVRRSVSLAAKDGRDGRFIAVWSGVLGFHCFDRSVCSGTAAASAPPAVGVVTVERQPMTDSYEFNGRIQPINSVNIVARVTAWLDKQLFVEGTDVKKGDLLYTLEKPPFQAAVDRQKAAVAQAEAQFANADIEFRRAQQLIERECRYPAAPRQRGSVETRGGGPVESGAGSARDRTDRSRLYGYLLSHRRPDRPHIGDDWKLGQLGLRYGDHSRQSGPDICGVSGPDAPRYRAAPAISATRAVSTR